MGNLDSFPVKCIVYGNLDSSPVKSIVYGNLDYSCAVKCMVYVKAFFIYFLTNKQFFITFLCLHLEMDFRAIKLYPWK